MGREQVVTFKENNRTVIKSEGTREMEMKEEARFT